MSTLRSAINLAGLFSGDSAGTGINSYSVGRGRSINWIGASGVRGYTVDQLFSGTLGGSPVDIDLASFTDRLGRAGITAFTKIRGAWIYAPADNAGNLTVFGSGATNPWNAWASDLIVRPGTTHGMHDESLDGYAVTSGSSQTVRISGTSGDYFELFLWGE